MSNVIDAWAQPALGRLEAGLTEVVRLLEKSGSAQYVDRTLSPDVDAVRMVKAGKMADHE